MTRPTKKRRYLGFALAYFVMTMVAAYFHRDATDTAVVVFGTVASAFYLWMWWDAWQTERFERELHRMIDGHG